MAVEFPHMKELDSLRHTRLEVKFLDLSRSVTFTTGPITKSTRRRVLVSIGE